jgi:hypothetical protein
MLIYIIYFDCNITTGGWEKSMMVLGCAGLAIKGGCITRDKKEHKERK